MDSDKKKLFYTAVDLSVHVVITIALSLYFYVLTGGWVWPMLSVIGGILIDIDHFIDHFLYFGFRFNLMSFLRHEYQASGKCYVFFHSWELLGILWFISVFVQWVFPIATGMTGHMIVDSLISHRTNLMSLSLIYRWRHGFNIRDSHLSNNK